MPTERVKTADESTLTNPPDSLFPHRSCRCVTNEKLISPFRGTYNSDDGHQVSLYAYLKAFRFTGSPALYLECDIHMCHNKCPVSRVVESCISRKENGITDFMRETTAAKMLLEEPVQTIDPQFGGRRELDCTRQVGHVGEHQLVPGSRSASRVGGRGHEVARI